MSPIQTPESKSTTLNFTVRPIGKVANNAPLQSCMIGNNRPVESQATCAEGK